MAESSGDWMCGLKEADSDPKEPIDETMLSPLERENAEDESFRR
jgi:hypothetical protein